MCACACVGRGVRKKAKQKRKKRKRGMNSNRKAERERERERDDKKSAVKSKQRRQRAAVPKVQTTWQARWHRRGRPSSLSQPTPPRTRNHTLHLTDRRTNTTKMSGRAAMGRHGAPRTLHGARPPRAGPRAYLQRCAVVAEWPRPVCPRLVPCKCAANLASSHSNTRSYQSSGRTCWSEKQDAASLDNRSLSLSLSLARSLSVHDGDGNGRGVCGVRHVHVRPPPLHPRQGRSIAAAACALALAAADDVMPPRVPQDDLAASYTPARPLLTMHHFPPSFLPLFLSSFLLPLLSLRLSSSLPCSFLPPFLRPRCR